MNELGEAFRALGIARKFYVVACNLGLEADSEMIRGDIERIRSKIREITKQMMEGGNRYDADRCNSGHRCCSSSEG